MNYFNERFKQIKHSELPTISGPNGNVGMKCLPQPFNNFLDPTGGFAFYPNFNYSRIFENDVRNCRNSNYLPPPVHGASNIKQTGSPFCYPSGMPSTLYQNCYHNGDPKAPHHPNFFYPPNFYPQPSRTSPASEFPEVSKGVNVQAETVGSVQMSNHESNGSGRSSNSSVVSTGQSSVRNCSYIPHRPFQNSDSLFWNSLAPSNQQKYHEKSSDDQLSQKDVSDPAAVGNKSQSQAVGNHSESSDFGRSDNLPMENSNVRQQTKSSTGSHKKNNSSNTSHFNAHGKNSRANAQSTVVEGLGHAEGNKMIATSLANATQNRLDGADKADWQNSLLSTSSSIASMAPPALHPSPSSLMPSSSSLTLLQQPQGSKHVQQNLKFCPIKCPLCGEQLQDNDQLDLHLRSHVDSLPPPNLTLLKTKAQSEGKKKKVTKKEAKATDNIKGEAGEGKAKPLCQCIGCQKTFTRVDKLKLHVSKRHPELLQSFYKCPHCQQGFEKCLALKQHLKSSHSGLVPKAKVKPQYTCEECGEMLSSRRDLVYHSMGHSGESPLHCPECGGRFTRPDKLKRHMFIHTGELPFTCSRCGQGFSRTDRLKEHTKLAHNESLLKCPSCDRVFDTWLQVKHHLKSHEYTCEECGESFTRKRKLQFHVMAHRTDKLLRCSECGIRFGHPSRLKKHIEFVHNSKVPLGRASISDSQICAEDASLIKVEPGCDPLQKYEEGHGDVGQVESWSCRLRRVEDLKKPLASFVGRTLDLDAEDFDDKDDENDDGDDGSYEYDCRRGLNQRRRKKKKSKFCRKLMKLNHYNCKVESKADIIKVDTGIVANTAMPHKIDIKKDIGEGEYDLPGDDKVVDSSYPNVSHDDRAEKDDDDTDVDGEVSTVFCSICYLSFGSREELVRHSREHVLSDPVDPKPLYNEASHSSSVIYGDTHAGFSEGTSASKQVKDDFTVIGQSGSFRKELEDCIESNIKNNNNNCDDSKVDLYTGQNHISSELLSSMPHANSYNE